MKFKVLSIALLSTILSTQAMAQFRLGIQGGMTVSSPTVEGLQNVKNYIAPKFGIVAEFDLGGFLLSPGLNYQNLGFDNSYVTNSGGAGTSNVTEQIRLTTLEVPLDLTYPIKTKSGKFLISLAPTFTLGMSGSNNISRSTSIGGGAPQVSNSTVDITYGTGSADLQKVNWGTRFGLGYAFNNGLQLNGTYNYGLTDLTNTSNTAIKTHNIGLTLSYFILK